MTKDVKQIDIDEVNRRINDGLITVRRHPFLDLRIFNYTHKTQYQRLWDQYTRTCRGLIVDGQNNILNNPFPKFYNLGETEETMIQNLPAEVPSITEKLDGMLGILYDEGDNPAIATRGSFDSPYAEWATNWLRIKGYSLDDFKLDYTYLFEIIYPENKIVVNYGDRAELILIAVRNNDNGGELNHIKEAEELGLSYAKEFSAEILGGNNKINDALKYLESCKGTDCEGFVCKYPTGLRVKIKSEDYRRLHKILAGLSAKSIWEMLRDKGSVEDVLGVVPDEFYSWIKKVESDITASKTDIMDRAGNIVKEARKLGSRTEQAEYIRRCTENCQDIRGVAFFLLDDRVNKAEYAAWQRVRPLGETFRMNSEDM